MSRSRRLRASRYRSLFALALPLWLALGSWAAEAHAGTRILLLEFGGRKSDVLRDKVVKSLEEAGNTVVLAERGSAGATKSELSRLAKSSNADVVVDGRVQRHSMRSWSVSLRVLDADNGRKVGQEVRFRNSWLPGLAKELLDRSASRLAKSISRAAKDTGSASGPSETWNADDGSVSSAAAADEPANDDSDASSNQGGDEAAGATKRPDNLFEVDPGVISDKPAEAPDENMSRIRGAISTRVGVVHRRFDFSDDIYDRLRKQDANIWVYQLQGEVYPFEQPVGDRLGVIARYEGAFSGNVRDSDFGGNFAIIYNEVFGGLRARYPLGGNWIGFDLTFGRMRAGLEDPLHRSNIPEVSYTMLRSSLDVDLAFGPVHAVGSAGFRLPLGYGEIERDDWFPRVGGYGVEASGGLEYLVSKGVSIEVSGSMRRYLLEMNSQPKDAINGVSEVAGGAVDLYMSGYFGMTFRL
jgi:hypothetical protein